MYLVTMLPKNKDARIGKPGIFKRMESHPANLQLAARAEKRTATGGQRQLIWDVLANLYDEEKNPNGIVSLGVAENALMHEETVAYFKAAMSDFSDFSLTYGDGASGSHRLTRAVTRFLNRHLKPLDPIQPHQITVTNGLSTSIEVSAFALGDPGDGFLLGRPFYGSFPSDLGTRAAVQTVTVSFGDIDPCSVEAVKCYEDALIQFEKTQPGKVKALILCNPHNPLGRCYPEETIVGLMKLCNKFKIHFISDEIYALSVWHNPAFPNAPKFKSVLAFDLKGIIDPQLVHVQWGLSKDFGANGLRIGCTISQHNPAFMYAIKAYGLFTYPAGPSDHLVSKLLEDDEFTEKYIPENQRRLSDAYIYVTDFLEKHDIQYAKGSNAAFFVWVDLGRSWGKLTGGVDDSRRKGLTKEIMDKLLAHKVYLASGDAFGSEHPGWIRIVFSQPRPMVDEGLRRMLQALQSS